MFNPEYVSRVETIKEECLDNSNANLSLVERFLEMGDFVDDKALKCFQKCVFVRLNTMNLNGEVEPDLVASQLPVSEKIDVESAIETCKIVKGTDPCQTAFLLWKCFVAFASN